MVENRISFNLIFRWQLLSTLYISLIQLATLVLLGRYLEMKELGAYAVFSIVFRFALYSLDPGMFFGIIQRHEYAPSLSRRLMRSQLFYMAASILVFGGLYLFTGLGKETGAVILANSLLMILIIKEYASAVFLMAPGAEVMGATMLALWLQGQTGPVAALAVLQVALTAVMTIAV